MSSINSTPFAPLAITLTLPLENFAIVRSRRSQQSDPADPIRARS
jgi:hypothetical protein